jgi:hypothetical protein
LVFDSTKLNLVKSGGKDAGDQTMHTDQVGMNLWGHYDDQKVVSREKKIEADYCFWQI